MIYLLCCLAILVADQITKYLVRENLPVGGEISVIGDFFKIAHVENDGAAFGMLGGNTGLLLAVPFVLIGALAIVLIKMIRDPGTSALMKLGVTWIVAGGIGNLIDRILFRHVTDMLSFSIFPPVFNVADIFVTLGAALLIFSLIKGGDRRDG